MSSDIIDHASGADTAPAASGCPVPHGLAKAVPEGVCPFPHGAAVGAPQRSKADEFMRTLLRIKERPAGVTDAAALKSFQKSMLISATRCTLTYVVFPFVLPALRFTSSVGAVVGIVIGVIALCSDVFTVRRFFAVDHKWRWYFTAAAVSVMTLLMILLVEDIANLLR